MEQSDIYRIRVRGELWASWSDRLGNMRITVDYSDKNKPVTTLEGRLRDQAALAGIMNTLYDLHMPLLSIECLDNPEE